jgi:small subunit ribosomal protein S5
MDNQELKNTNPTEPTTPSSTTPVNANPETKVENRGPRPTTNQGGGMQTLRPRPIGQGPRRFVPRPAGSNGPSNQGTNGPRREGGFKPANGTIAPGTRIPGSTGPTAGGPRREGGFGGPNGASKFGNRGPNSNSRFGGRDNRRTNKPEEPKDNFTAEVITVRRVTRVVKGGKRMRFAALVVVGDKMGTIGFANKKGMDFQDAVAKATKKAKENVIKISLTEGGSVPFSTVTKFKAAKILLKPAPTGTSLIAGGYVRPVLQLAGIKNIYSKILGSNNKVVGVEAVIKALSAYSAPKNAPKAKNVDTSVESTKADQTIIAPSK